MFLSKIRISTAKIILPFLQKILQFLKANTRGVNFLNEKKNNANNVYNFQKNVEELLNIRLNKFRSFYDYKSKILNYL